MIEKDVVTISFAACLLGGVIDVFFLGNSPGYWTGGICTLILMVVVQAIITLFRQHWK